MINLAPIAGQISGIFAVMALAMGSPAMGQDHCPYELLVLGAGQDAGAPQIGNGDDRGANNRGANNGRGDDRAAEDSATDDRATDDRDLSLLPTSLALMDRENGKRYLFDASPAITEQLAMLDRVMPPLEASRHALGIDGIFLTHAHMGHYLGLAWLGLEAANSRNIPVYAMPRMAAFLRENGPWGQLVELGNIAVNQVAEGGLIALGSNLAMRPIRVPHRDEYSETVGWAIHANGVRALYLPDFDSWQELEQMWGIKIDQIIDSYDILLIDATFWDDGELGRDMSAIPHPRVRASMDMMQHLPVSDRAKIHFIHYNHSNPIRDPASTESGEVEMRGFQIARRGMRICMAPRAAAKTLID